MAEKLPLYVIKICVSIERMRLDGRESAMGTNFRFKSQAPAAVNRLGETAD
jgi:hypothetical protein